MRTVSYALEPLKPVRLRRLVLQKMEVEKGRYNDITIIMTENENIYVMKKENIKK